MIASEIGLVTRDQGVSLTAQVRLDRVRAETFRLEWTLPEGSPDWLSTTADPVLAALLLPAMVSREDLVIEGTVSPRLYKSLQTLMDIYAAWVPGTARPRIVVDLARARPRRDGVGLFFSGGVDSFYSLLKPMTAESSSTVPVSHLILVYGFDIRPRNRALFDLVAQNVRRVARETSRRLVIVETNLRDFGDRIVGWDFYHGGALASIGLALAGSLGTCLIASTHSYDELVPFGSHPLLDPLWSTEHMDFCHDGAEASRTKKIRHISQFPLVLETLRVCWPDWGMDYNCGRCEKCLRTMVALHAAGALEGSHTFPRALDLRTVGRMQLITGESSIRFLEDLLSVLDVTERDRDLARALKRVIWHTRWRRRAGRAVRSYLGPNASLAGLRAAIPSPLARLLSSPRDASGQRP